MSFYFSPPQAFFLATLGYTSDKVIVNLTSKRDLKDGRGRHKPKHALQDSVKEQVIQHVQSIDWDGQGVKMSGKYEEFLQGHPDITISYETYRKIVAEHKKNL